MCRRRTTNTQGALAHESYTDETRRLNQQAPMGGTRRLAAWRGGFPWWTLWLLWPLIGGFKAAGPVVWSGMAALSQVTVPLLPLVVVVGVLVVLGRR